MPIRKSLASAGVLTAPREEWMLGATHFGPSAPAVKCRFQRSVYCSWTVQRSNDEMHWIHRDELGEFLNDAALTERGVEVGSGAGEFATTVLRHWQGRQLTLIDSWAPQGHDAYLDCCNVTRTEHAANRTAAACLAANDHRVRLLEGLSPDAAGQFENATLDYVYIDGNHAYLAVREDLRAWNPKVRPGGLLAGHDYLDGSATGASSESKRPLTNLPKASALPCHCRGRAPWVSWYFRKPL